MPTVVLNIKKNTFRNIDEPSPSFVDAVHLFMVYSLGQKDPSPCKIGLVVRHKLSLLHRLISITVQD